MNLIKASHLLIPHSYLTKGIPSNSPSATSSPCQQIETVGNGGKRRETAWGQGHKQFACANLSSFVGVDASFGGSDDQTNDHADFTDELKKYSSDFVCYNDVEAARTVETRTADETDFEKEKMTAVTDDVFFFDDAIGVKNSLQ
ncbi:hypothetical protein KGF57_000196 [Candida theae]|uniref:Uncharacterized protein n=1 Tax=Candida theae TaxID=1198502 RepID=A0AAD5BJJ5_9ASCO|nr:uncharacterized protein KGF57_000196 [Candida theae]KAI5968502.1 hypothetical protein KGF57_000196 [Candida theae]